MASPLIKYGLNSFLILAIIGMGYFGVQTYAANPCSVPKTFSVTDVDPRFGISKATVIDYAQEAASVWNDEYSENELLKHVETGGDITITFVYDERQRTTIQNERLKRTIEQEKSELDDLKRTIESLREEYTTLEASILTKTRSYNARLAKHNSEVSYWNSQGGAPNDVYQKLQREEAALETERLALNASINRYNQLASRIKNYGKSHNEVVTTLNDKINTLNQTALREFEEGTYDPNTKTITIYEYGSVTALKRVLIHELGHALGLDHTEDEESIMYPINQGKGLELAEEDKRELSRICKEKKVEDLVSSAKTIRDDISHLLVWSWHGIVARQQ